MTVGRLSAIPEGTRYYDEEDSAGTGGESGATDKDAKYWQAEAKKAFADRDTFKKKLRDLEGSALSGDQLEEYAKLKADSEKAEETRKKRAGEYDSLTKTMAEKHAKEKADLETRLGAIAERFKTKVVTAEFGSAADYFNNKTILDIPLAMDALSKFVKVEDVEDDPDGLGYRVVVKHPKGGHTILGDDGNPAPFAQAIDEVIQALPNKDRILRGGGKTGSGSSGGTNRSVSADLVELTQLARQGDKKALEQLRQRRAASGGLVMGSAFSR